MEQLIRKYDRPGPRYTSYPPVPFWKGGVDASSWLAHLQTELERPKAVDVYLHIPYCQSLCWYCGCHRVINKNLDTANLYVDALMAEWGLYQAALPQLEVGSVHLGGGTPTFLKPTLLDNLLSKFTNKSKNFIGAVEVDPRTCEEEHLAVLNRHGFTRLSMGIQDFDPAVQKLINRHQPVELVRSLVDKVRAYGFKSINFDLIYGLPGQNLKSVENTIGHVVEMLPDCIAFYSYAHLPDRMANQRLIHDSDLPAPQLKRALYERGRELLFANNYIEIGMDHFALKGSFLAESAINKKLVRSFMGYTDQKSEILIGLGASSISQTKSCYAQNEKKVETYQDLALKGILPIVNGHWLTQEQIQTAECIQSLMCHGEVTVPYPVAEQLIGEMETDGILDWDRASNFIRLTSVGMAFVRNVAMAIDPMLKDAHISIFSRTV